MQKTTRLMVLHHCWACAFHVYLYVKRETLINFITVRQSSPPFASVICLFHPFRVITLEAAILMCSHYTDGRSPN